MADVLAQQIKDIQRADPSGKQAWWNYADKEGSNVRDPAKHEESFLQNFIDQYHSGAFKDVAPTERKAQHGQDAGELGEFFKDCQRNSPSFKTAWSSFVDMRGMRKNDPTQAGKENLVTFLEFVSQQGMMAMAMMAGGGNGGKGGGGMNNQMGGMNNQMGGNMGGGNMGNMGGNNMGNNMGNQMGGGNMGNNMGNQTVAPSWTGGGGDMGGNMNQMGNQMGGNMGGNMNQGQNDYQAANKQMANMMGVNAAGGDGMGGGMIQQRMQMMQQMQNGGGGGMGQPAMKKQRTGDPMKEALVEKVKMFQRAGNEQKQAWWTFCDAQEGQNRDPARYEADVLQMFCAAYQM